MRVKKACTYAVFWHFTACSANNVSVTLFVQSVLKSFSAFQTVVLYSSFWSTLCYCSIKCTITNDITVHGGLHNRAEAAMPPSALPRAAVRHQEKSRLTAALRQKKRFTASLSENDKPSCLWAGLAGFEPAKWRSQSPLPYRLAIAQCLL